MLSDLRRPRVVHLRIPSIENPSRQGLVIRVLLDVSRAGESSVPIGEVSPFPPDQPGEFILPLPREATNAISDSRVNMLRVDIRASLGELARGVVIELEASFA